MASPSDRSGGGERYDDIAAETLDLLEELYEWRLPGSRWRQVREVLDTMTTTVVSDATALETAATTLRELSPLRVKAIGEEPTEPPPTTVRDRLNQLVHTMDRESADSEQDGRRDE